MNLKKGLTLIAIGFLFTLVDINLTFDGAKVNITPQFVGWILIFLAIDSLGKYVSGKMYLKWLALALAMAFGVIWAFDVFKPELSTSIIKVPVNILATVYMFILFGVLEEIAHDCGSKRESTIRTLKIVNLALYIGALVLVPFTEKEGLETIAYIFLIIGLAMLTAAIITAVVLFQLRKDVVKAEQQQ